MVWIHDQPVVIISMDKFRSIHSAKSPWEIITCRVDIIGAPLVYRSSFFFLDRLYTIDVKCRANRSLAGCRQPQTLDSDEANFQRGRYSDVLPFRPNVLS